MISKAAGNVNPVSPVASATKTLVPEVETALMSVLTNRAWDTRTGKFLLEMSMTSTPPRYGLPAML